MVTEAASIDELINCLEKSDLLPLKFDPMLWRLTVERVLVNSDGTIRFIMVGGKEYSFTIY